MKKIILASGSPRRRELLSQINIDYEVVKSDVKENVPFDTPAYDVPMLLSKQKAEDVLLKCRDKDVIVIGADTVVVFEGKILGKPKDESDAYKMIKELSGKSHMVYTGVTLSYYVNQKMESESFTECTKVSVAELSDEEISEYIKTKEPYDKAGSYGIQGIFAKYITGIEGDYYNVVGLPLAKLYKILKIKLKTV